MTGNSSSTTRPTKRVKNSARSAGRQGRQVPYLRCVRPVALVAKFGVGDLASADRPLATRERTHVHEHTCASSAGQVPAWGMPFGSGGTGGFGDTLVVCRVLW